MDVEFSSIDELNCWFRSLSKEEKRTHGVKYNEWKGRLKDHKPVPGGPQFKTDPVEWLAKNLDKVAYYKIHDRGYGEVEAHAEIIVSSVSSSVDENDLRKLASERFELRYHEGLLIQSMTATTKSKRPNYRSDMLTVTEWRREA